MLKLDAATRHIPVVTYTDGSEQSTGEDEDDTADDDDDFTVVRPSTTMN
jgi:hypothetical protein